MIETEPGVLVTSRLRRDNTQALSESGKAACVSGRESAKNREDQDVDQDLDELLRRITEMHGKKISRFKAAKALSLPVWKLDIIISHLGLEWQRHIRGGSVEIDGFVDTWVGHSSRLGITVGALRWRIKNNGNTDMDEVVPITEQEARQFTDLRKQGVPAWAAAAKVGQPYANLRVAAIRFCKDYADAVNQAPRIRRSPDELHAAKAA